MKKLILISILFLLLASSCGPHRMSCGARGICESKSESKKNNS
jgi:hypothetical protein